MGSAIRCPGPVFVPNAAAALLAEAPQAMGEARGSKGCFQLHGTAQYCTTECQACGVINTDLLPPLPFSGLARHSQQSRGLPRPCVSLLFIAGD